jgi:hypothetical protein
VDATARAVELAVVEGHITQGELHITGQLRVIERLRELGCDLQLAESLLASLYVSQDLHRKHRERLIGDTIARH